MANKKIFIIHGWTYSIKPWTAVVSILKTKGIDVVQLKVPGLTEKSNEVFAINDYVNWLHNQIKDENNPIIVAHSNGGRIALNYLNKYPKSFAKLILIGSAGIYDDTQKTSFKKQTTKALSKAFKPLSKIPIIKKIVYRMLGVKDYHQAPENMKKTLNNVINSDKNLIVKDNNVKTALIWGEKDTETPLWMGKQIHKKIPNSTLYTNKDWGHAPYITHPNELAKKLNEEIVEVKQ